MSGFPVRLKELRQSRNITQRTMAEFLGMREQAYQKYEYGQREPNYDKLVKICRHLQISTDYLLGLSRDPVIRDPIVNEETVAQAI